MPLRWRHNDHAGVSNHQPHGCLLNRLFRRKSKKTSKLRVTGLCAGNSPGTGDRWISRTNGQLRGKCFHLMTSSCHDIIMKLTCFLQFLWPQLISTQNFIDQAQSFRMVNKIWACSLSMSEVSANESRCYICNGFSHWLRLCPAIVPGVQLTISHHWFR